MKNIIAFIIENWAGIVATICVIVVGVRFVVEFVKLSREEQVKRIKECLLAWVIAAEKDLGSGTGKVKLSTVYGKFVLAFPIIKNFVTIEKFDELVNEALTTMNEMLSTNKSLNKVVNGVETSSEMTE